MDYQNSGSLQGPMQAAFAKVQKGRVMSVNITSAEQVFNAVKAVPGKSAKHYAEVTKVHYSTVCNILAQSKVAKLVRSVEVTLAKGHKHRLWHPERLCLIKTTTTLQHRSIASLWNGSRKIGQ